MTYTNIFKASKFIAVQFRIALTMEILIVQIFIWDFVALERSIKVIGIGNTSSFKQNEASQLTLVIYSHIYSPSCFIHLSVDSFIHEYLAKCLGKADKFPLQFGLELALSRLINTSAQNGAE